MASTKALTHTPSSESRLYVGNLSPAVDEYVLVKVFSKYGHISQLDYLFHKTGPARGKPRGYAFVEMSSRDEAIRAMLELHDKAIRGRNIVVTFANEGQYHESEGVRSSGQRRGSFAFRPTTLSILKSQQQPKGTRNKIAALEAKLAEMHDTNPHPTSEDELVTCTNTTNTPTCLPNKPSLATIVTSENPNLVESLRAKRFAQRDDSMSIFDAQNVSTKPNVEFEPLTSSGVRGSEQTLKMPPKVKKPIVFNKEGIGLNKSGFGKKK